MIRRPPRSTRTDTLFPYTTLFRSDLVIVPALSGDMRTTLEMNQEFIPWIVRQHRDGAEVASLCLGAFLLASTGLLNDKECSPHWLYAEEFRQMFPEVRLVDGRIISDEHGLYSSGDGTHGGEGR